MKYEKHRKQASVNLKNYWINKNNMSDEIYYKIYTLPKDGFGLYYYLFKHKIMEDWLEPNNRVELESAFYKKSGISKENEPIVDIDQSEIISVI